MTRVSTRPASAVSIWTGIIGVLALFGAVAILKNLPFTVSPVEECFLLLASAATSMALYEILIVQAHRRASTGLAWDNALRKFIGSFKDRDLYIKIAGYALSIGFLAFAWSAPIYNGDYYRPYFDFLWLYMPLIVCVAILYFFFINAVMTDRRDGLWHLAAFFIPSLRAQADRSIIKTHMVSLCVKAFFMPLMFVFFFGQWGRLSNITEMPVDFRTFFETSVHGIFFLDVAFSTIGYAFTLKLFDAHIRLPEMRWGGWVACLICYAPFNQVVFDQFLNYHDDITWQTWLNGYPSLYAIWGSLILLSYIVYVAATVNFGLRFSNLTNRGLLTHGMYAYTKHPAYISKNFSWWLEQIPFITTSFTVGLKHSIVLCIVNYVYYLRAKYEEKTMSDLDDSYREYADYIREHGIFAKIGRLIKRSA